MQLLRGTKGEEALRALLKGAKALPAIALDPPSLEGETARVAAIATPDDALLLDIQGIASLGELLAGQGVLAAANAKKHHRALLRTFNQGPARWACVQLSEVLIAGGRPVDLSLPAISARYDLPEPPSPDDGLNSLGHYAQHIAQVVAAQIPRIQELNLTQVSRLEAAAVAPVAEMEHRGMCLDAPGWRDLARKAQLERDDLKARLHKFLSAHINHDLFGGAALNLDSNAELLKVLRAMGHPLPNVKKESLQTLPEPFGPWLLRYREVSKITSTYGESFLATLGPDQRLHPTFEQIGANTGRMACHSPNLQAVVKTSHHRDCFRCAPHRRVVVADYATCELRILAHMSRDPVFLNAFAKGEDLHATVASTLWNTPVSKTQNPELRHRAKAVNFGLVYGMGPGGLAKNLKISSQQALNLLEDYFRTFPKIRDFLNSNAEVALKRGYAETLTGRRLYLDGSGSESERAQAERVAKNMPIQGSSADMTKLALADVRRRLLRFKDAWLVNAVHDELVVECDAKDAEAVAEELRGAMVHAGQTLLPSIPIEVDVGVGHTWSK